MTVGVGGSTAEAELATLTSMRGDVPHLMAAADAFVLSSAWEGMPMVLLEASASALPIVATRVGGNAEVVLEGESGLVAPPHDSAALAKHMLRIMSMSPTERAAMGSRWRNYVKAAYDRPTILDTWERIYLGLMERAIAPTISPETGMSLR